MSLTDAQIKRLKAPDTGQKTFFDDALPGFGVRVSQGGTKTFVVVCGANRKRRSIGRYPEITLAEARARAKGIQAEAALESPREHARPALTYEDARRMFLEDCDGRNRPRTVAEYRRLLERHFDLKGRLDQVDRHQIMRKIEPLRDTPAEQQHAFVAIRTMMNWCWKRGYIAATPVPPLTFRPKPRDRVLTDEELAVVWGRAVEFGYPLGPIVQLLIRTGQRRSEITNLRRSWLRDNAIVLPASHVKNGREHTVPLTAGTHALLRGLPQQADLFFPSRVSDEKPYDGFSRAKRRFDAGIMIAPYTLHDLRRTFSSNLARFGVPIHVTEKILNHASGAISGVAAVYNRHSYFNEMRDALIEHDEFLARISSSCYDPQT